MRIDPHFLEITRKVYFAAEDWREWLLYLCDGVCCDGSLSVLDLCGGTGYVSRWLSGFNGCDIKFVVFDKDSELLNYGSSFKNDHCLFFQGDALNLPFPGNSYEVVFLHGAYHLFEDVNTLASQIYKVCAKKAVFFCADMSFTSPYNYYCDKMLSDDLSLFNNWQELPFVMRKAGFKRIKLTCKMIRIDYSSLSDDDYNSIRQFEKSVMSDKLNGLKETISSSDIDDFQDCYSDLIELCNTQRQRGEESFLWDGGPVMIYECFK